MNAPARFRRDRSEIVAYNSDYIVCVWMGFDKTDSAHSLEQGVTGGTYPAAFRPSLLAGSLQRIG